MSNLLGNKGLDPHKFYPAVVRNNDDSSAEDGRKLGRIQAFVEGTHDGLATEDLPWCMPHWEHVDGSTSESGVFCVPKIGSQVLLKFQNGDPQHPIYYGYPGDTATQLAETRHNYPNRAVIRFKNGMCVILDTTSNEVYVQAPGKVKAVIAADFDLTVLGNMTTRVSGESKVIVDGHSLMKSSSKDEFVKENLNVSVEGDAAYFSKGKTDIVATAKLSTFGASIEETAIGNITLNGIGGGIDLDPSPGSGPSAPSAPNKPSVTADSFTAVSRGPLPQSWSDRT